VGAFKYRGALNAVKKFLEEQPKGEKRATTFVTHSSGNHAQALALAARDSHCKAVIVMVRAAYGLQGGIVSQRGW
jgi:threonine dehydratase